MAEVMISLCEKCFPGWKEVEVITIPPMSPCAACGVWDGRTVPSGISVHTFGNDPRGPGLPGNKPPYSGHLPPSAIEGVPLKEVMIDAICGAGFSNAKVAMWAQSARLANFTGNQWNEDWTWNRTMLGMLELDALFAVYGRVKRK